MMFLNSVVSLAGHKLGKSCSGGDFALFDHD